MKVLHLGAVFTLFSLLMGCSAVSNSIDYSRNVIDDLTVKESYEISYNDDEAYIDWYLDQLEQYDAK